MNTLKLNNRGFGIVHFSDSNNEQCSLQESSSDNPSIWLGIDRVTPRLFLPDIDNEKRGWIDYPIPEYVNNYGRMHLTQSQVRELLPYLEHFAKYGDIRIGNNEKVLTTNDSIQNNNYENMWKELKEKINSKIKFHQSGAMQSISESICGEADCKEFLEMMEKMEKEN